MANQERAGDAPSGDVVDAFPLFSFRSRLDDTRPSVEEAMEVHREEAENFVIPTYDMTHPKRGIGLIINNEQFHPKTGMNSRSGSSEDVVSMKKVLNKLGFKVIVRNDMTVGQMRKMFEDISLDDHSGSDCFVCVILSHGDDGGVIYGTDGSVALDDLVAYVLPDKCVGLAEKPKLFFVQACRGTKLDKGVGVEESDAIGGFGSNPAKKIPLWADMLIAFSSVPGYYSWRNCRNGSWFIQSLCHVLERYGAELEIQQIMTKVNHRVAYEYESKSNEHRMNRMKQIPCVASMLTKELYFPPLKASD